MCLVKCFIIICYNFNNFSTPGRIIDLIKIEATDFIRTSFLVFDEADRLFELGFGK